MDSITRSAAVVLAAFALGLPLPYGAFASLGNDDRTKIALLQHAMHRINHGPDMTFMPTTNTTGFYADRSCPCPFDRDKYRVPEPYHARQYVGQGRGLDTTPRVDKAKANRERLTLLRAREARQARQAVIWEPRVPSEWLSHIEQQGFKAGPPREKKEKKPTVVRRGIVREPRVEVVWKDASYDTDAQCWTMARWKIVLQFPSPNGATYSLISPVEAPVHTRYVPCVYLTLMEGVLKTNEDGDEITIEDVGMDGDRVVY